MANLALIKNTVIGQMVNGELIVGFWGKAVSTGIRPNVVGKKAVKDSGVYNERIQTGFILDGERHVKGDKIFTIFGQTALVECNEEMPKVITIEEARKMWVRA